MNSIVTIKTVSGSTIHSQASFRTPQELAERIILSGKEGSEQWLALGEFLVPVSQVDFIRVDSAGEAAGE